MHLRWHITAHGPCIQCGKESEGSFYLLPMDDEVWAILRPSVEDMTPVSPWSGVKLVTNTLFWEGICKPLCGAACATKHKEENDGKAA